MPDISTLKIHFDAIASTRDSILADIRSGRKNAAARHRFKDLARMAEKIMLSPDYIHMQRAVISDMTRSLSNDASFVSDALEWDSMSLGERMDVMKSFVCLLAQSQSHVSGFLVRPPAFYKTDWHMASLADADCRLDDLHGENDNIRWKENFLSTCSFEDAIRTAAHEQTHVFQAWMARGYENGWIGPGHPGYKDCMLFSLVRRHDAYVSSKIREAREAYEAQFEERDAEMVAMALRAYAASIVQRHSPAQRRNGAAIAGCVGLLGGLALGCFTRPETP